MATIAEIRQKFPQYEDLSDQQLADALHAKHYSDMPRAEFDQKIGLAPSDDGYQPSMVPWMDRFSAAANSAVDAIPIVGPALTSVGNNVDAAFASMVEGRPVTPEERAEINKAQQEQFPLESAAGTVAGAVGPLTGLGMTSAIAGRALGMTGGLGSQVGLGALSSGALTGADTLARGGSMEDAATNATVGAALGGAAPVVMKGVGAAWNGLTRQGVPAAAKNVSRALAEDGIDARNLSRMLAAQGPDAMVMDLGDNMRTLAGGIAANRGQGQTTLRNAVAQRAAGSSARVADDVARTIGTGDELGDLTAQIVAGQKAAADPLYTAVRDVPVPMEGNIKFVAQTPLGQRAFKQALELAANDGVPTDRMTIGILDYAKQALDDIQATGVRQGQNNAARQAGQLARLLAGEGDKIAPGYKAAREAFAGPAKVLEAIESGRGTFKANMSPADMTRLMADMTASEKDAFLQGAQTALADLVGNAGNDVVAVRNLFRKSYNEAKLRALIGDDAATDLLRSIDRELMFGETANTVTKNSETARRTLAAGMVNPEQTDVSPQGVVGLVFAAINAARAKARSIMQPKVNSQMADLLSSKAPSQQDLARLMAGQAAPRPLPVAPGALPVLGGQAQDRNSPLRIVVNGAGSYGG